jgi:hypothetical protein
MSMIKALNVRRIALALFLSTTGAIGRAQNLAITSATVYSAPDAPARRNVTVVIRHGLIAEVGEHLRVPKNIETISCQGCVVLAGFWNTHVHFMEQKWNDAANQPAYKLASQMSEMLTHSGFTTVVDTGSDEENTVALRRRVESGEVLGPRILTAGFPLFPAHALPYYLADLPADLKAKMAQPETATAAATIVDRNRAGGSDLVKLFTGSIVSPNRIAVIDKEPAQITTDGHASYARAIHKVLGAKVKHRCNAYLNRRIEQDHRGIKQRYYPMLGFGSLPCARRFCRAFEEVRQYFRPRRKRKQFVSLAKQRRQFISKALTLAYLFEAA